MPRMIRKTVLNGSVAHPPVSHAKIEADEADDSASADDVSATPAPVDALSELMTSLQGASSARINVYRIVKNQPPSYVFECAPESFSLDELRDKYNGGEFRLYVMKEGRLWKNTRVIVEPRQIISNGIDPSPPTQMFDMMSLIRDGFSAQTAAMREIASGRSGPSMFSGMDLPAVITAAAAAITALRPPPAPPPAPVADTTSQALDMFMKGMQIAMDVRDNTPAADNSIGGMLRDVLRSPILAAAIQQQTTPPPAPPARPAPPILAAPSAAAEVSHAKMEPAMQSSPAANTITHYLGFLTQKAAADADPGLYAEMVLDNLTDEELIPMLERGSGLIDDFVALHPPVGNHRAWFESLIQAVRLAMESTDDVPPTPENQHALDAAAIVVPGNAS